MTEDEQAQVNAFVEIIPPGWTFTIGQDMNTGEPAWMIQYDMIDGEWTFYDMSFDEAYGEILSVLESFEWN